MTLFSCFFRYVDLLLSNSNLIDYIYTILRNERTSLNDPIILTFIEIYFPKVSLLFSLKFLKFRNSKLKWFHFDALQVTMTQRWNNLERLIDTICQNICSKENYEELLGDLLAIRVMTQNSVSVSSATLKELQDYMKSLHDRFRDEFAAMEGEGKLRILLEINVGKNFTKIIDFEIF